ncbi:MAG: tyrosine-protein phosphatase [Actinomycetota bacterium]|nr:tyrosine-protein phosphatase [Actinomycetota bacterium]
MSESSLAPGQNIPVESLPNLRDVGGYPTRDGQVVRRGCLYRSILLGRLTDGDVHRVRDLGIQTIFDLRTAAEQKATPDRDIGARSIGLDVLADRSGEGPASLLGKMDDPAAISAALADGQGSEMMRTAYRELVTLPSAHDAYNRFFKGLAGADAIPALVHCTTGKDRTGWAAASTLLFLGVGEEDVFHDYLLTNDQLVPALKPIFDQFESVGGDPDVLRPVLSVDRTYLETAIDLMTETYGSIDGYMTEGLGLDDTTLTKLRDRLLQAA